MTQPDRIGFDREAALARVDGDAELLRELAQLFLDDCPRLLAEIRDGVARQDAVAVQRAAHTLKGAVGNFAAQDAFDAALDLEDRGRSQDTAGIMSAALRLDTAVGQLQEAMAAFVAEGPA